MMATSRSKRLSGGFELNDINGRIELDQVSGAGNAKTVNGDVKPHSQPTLARLFVFDHQRLGAHVFPAEPGG